MRCSRLSRLRTTGRFLRQIIPTRPGLIRCKSTAEDRVKVKFTIPHHVEFGQSICVLGSELELGNWQVEQSRALEWTQGDVWTGVVDLPSKQIEYKYVTVNQDGTPAEWQPGENLVAEIENGETVEIVDEWDGTFQENSTSPTLHVEPDLSPEDQAEEITAEIEYSESTEEEEEEEEDSLEEDSPEEDSSLDEEEEEEEESEVEIDL